MERTSKAYPNEVFTVERIDENTYQTVYPAELSENGAVFATEATAWGDIHAVCNAVNVELDSL